MAEGLNEADEIVRALAAGEPPYDDAGYVSECAFCRVRLDYDDATRAFPDIADASRHAPTCLWRRAKVLYPDTKEG